MIIKEIIQMTEQHMFTIIGDDIINLVFNYLPMKFYREILLNHKINTKFFQIIDTKLKYNLSFIDDVYDNHDHIYHQFNDEIKRLFGLDKIKKLRIWGNYSNSPIGKNKITPEILLQFTNLNSLKMCDHGIKEIPKLAYLKDLICEYCYDLAKISSQLINLHTLKCEGCILLKEIPPELINLQILILNSIGTIKIPFLNNLKYLDISDTQIFELSSNLINLETFICQGNSKIKEIPETYINLTYLNYRETQITFLPQTLTKLKILLTTDKFKINNKVFQDLTLLQCNSCEFDEKSEFPKLKLIVLKNFGTNFQKIDVRKIPVSFQKLLFVVHEYYGGVELFCVNQETRYVIPIKYRKKISDKFLKYFYDNCNANILAQLADIKFRTKFDVLMKKMEKIHQNILEKINKKQQVPHHEKYFKVAQLKIEE